MPQIHTSLHVRNPEHMKIEWILSLLRIHWKHQRGMRSRVGLQAERKRKRPRVGRKRLVQPQIGRVREAPTTSPGINGSQTKDRFSFLSPLSVVSKLSAYKSFKDVIGLPSMSPSLKRNLLSSTPRVLVSTEVRNLLSRHSQCLATPSPEAIAETPRRKLFATPLMTTTRRSSSAGGGFPSRAEPEPYHSTHMSISPYAGDDTVDLFDDSRSTLMTHHPSR
mmetsp:Transcript_19583/g.78011  ORF Transcript_19583/g.78011 Transcript_19583/m.78011 type:complete len:221 (-) Transcript_19583:1165-1827(-)